MPLYDYLCTNCGKSCEMLEKVNDAPAVPARNCGKDQLKRQVSAPSFQLKGTGWYVTDFKNKDKPAKALPPPPRRVSNPSPAKPLNPTPKPARTKIHDINRWHQAGQFAVILSPAV